MMMVDGMPCNFKIAQSLICMILFCQFLLDVHKIWGVHPYPKLGRFYFPNSCNLRPRLTPPSLPQCGRTSLKYPNSLNNRTCSHGGDGAEEDSDRVSSADGVAVLLEVGGEGLVVQRLDYVHPRVVQGLEFGWTGTFYLAVKRIERGTRNN